MFGEVLSVRRGGSREVSRYSESYFYLGINPEVSAHLSGGWVFGPGLGRNGEVEGGVKGGGVWDTLGGPGSVERHQKEKRDWGSSDGPQSGSE